MGKPLKTAVIGTGIISKQHLSFLDLSKQSEWVGICTLSAAAVNNAADTLHAHHADTNHQEMLAATNLDIVHILTLPKTHRKRVADCLNTVADRNLPNPVHQLFAGAAPDVIAPMGHWLLRFISGVDRVATVWSNHGGIEMPLAEENWA